RSTRRKSRRARSRCIGGDAFHAAAREWRDSSVPYASEKGRPSPVAPSVTRPVLPGPSPSEEDLADERDRKSSLRDECVVELLQAGALLRAILVAKLLALDFAERVVEVRRVVSAAPRFLVGVPGLLEPFFDEDLRAVLDAHPLRMELDPDDVAAVAQ